MKAVIYERYGSPDVLRPADALVLPISALLMTVISARSAY